MESMGPCTDPTNPRSSPSTQLRCSVIRRWVRRWVVRFDGPPMLTTSGPPSTFIALYEHAESSYGRNRVHATGSPVVDRSADHALIPGWCGWTLSVRPALLSVTAVGRRRRPNGSQVSQRGGGEGMRIAVGR